MTPADLTFAPRLRGRRARAHFVRRPSQARQPGLRARLAPTWAAWWRLSKGAGVVEDAAEEVSWDLAGGRSTPVDHVGGPSGSRVPLRTPIVERDAGLRDEHPAATRVQLRAPRSSEGSRAFARSRLNGARDLAEAARSRSQTSSLQSDFWLTAAPPAAVLVSARNSKLVRDRSRFVPLSQGAQAKALAGQKSASRLSRGPREPKGG